MKLNVTLLLTATIFILAVWFYSIVVSAATLQSNTPGTADNGHTNINGTGVFGTCIGAGVEKPQGVLDAGNRTDPDPITGECPVGYIHVDYDENSLIDSGECWKGMTVNEGNVGIGTTTPEEILDINGLNLKIGDSRKPEKTKKMCLLLPAYNNPTIRPLAVLCAENKQTTQKINIGGGTGNGIFTSAATSIGLFTNPTVANSEGTARLWITSAGYIGIGTTTPTEKLDVVGTVKATSFLGDGSGLTGILTYETDPIFGASPASGITNVDITNWDTAYSWGDHSLEGYLTYESDPVFVASPAYGISNEDITNWNTAYGWGDHSLAGYLTYETDPIFTVSPAYGISDEDINNWDTAYGWGDHHLEGYLKTETDPQVGENSQNRVPKWNGSALVTGTIFDDGNVGIGTTSPSNKLDVVGNANVSGTFTANHVKIGATSGGTDLVVTGDTDLTVNGGGQIVLKDDTAMAAGVGGMMSLSGNYVTAGGYIDFAAIRGYKQTGVTGNPGGVLAFYSRDDAGNTWSTLGPRMIIDKDGNVGIGTTSPGAKLDIYSTSDSGDNDMFELSDSGGLVLQAGKGGPSDDGFLDIYDNAGNRDVRIHTVGASWFRGGNVGIGTASPIGKLEVKGTNLDANSQFRISTTQGDIMRIAIASDGSMNFWNGTNSAFVNSSGVWVNASDIAYKKDVEDLNYGLQEILSLQPRFYRMKDTNKAQIGFIAQEVEQIIPEVVSGKDGSKGLAYSQLTAVTVNAIKELKTEIDTVKEENKTLKAENEQLRNTLASLTDRQTALEDVFLSISTVLPKEKLVKLGDVQNN